MKRYPTVVLAIVALIVASAVGYHFARQHQQKVATDKALGTHWQQPGNSKSY